MSIPNILRELAAEIEAGRARENVISELTRRMNKPAREEKKEGAK